MSGRTASAVVRGAVLRLQRLGLRPPPRLRALARRWVGRAVGTTTPLPPWDEPLTAGSTPAPALASSSPSLSRAPSGQAPTTQAQLPEPPPLEPVPGAPGLRCLLVTTCLDAGGMDEVVAFLARELPRLGLVTAVLHVAPGGTPAGEPTGRLGRLLRQDGVEVVQLDDAAARTWLRTWSPDVVSAHGAPEWSLDECADLGVGFVDVLHGMHELLGCDWAAQAARARKVAAFVAVSELVRAEYLRGNPGYPADRVVTVPNAVSARHRPPEDRCAARRLLGVDEEFLVVSLARHCLQKNTYATLTAFDSVVAAHPQARLLVTGRSDDAWYTSQVLAHRAQLRHGGHMHVRDHAHRPSVLLAAADAFVLNSFFEGWALSSMEALYAGVPVVLSDVGGAREQVAGHPERGFVVSNPTGSPTGMTWESLRRMRFAPQPNHDELVGALGSLVEQRAQRQADRPLLAAAAPTWFPESVPLRGHAEVLVAAAKTAPSLR